MLPLILRERGGSEVKNILTIIFSDPENVYGHNRLPLSSAVVVFLFLAGLWFTEANINSPNFHPKLTLAAPTIGYSVSLCVSC